jgi:hypothetical protein
MSDKDYLNLYRSIIEERYLLGTSDSGWRQRDFEALARIIEDKSGVRLSLSTLKRLWRSDSITNPHPSTLDALASLVDAKDWLDFKKDYPPETVKKGTSSIAWTTVAVLVAALVLVGFFVIKPETDKLPGSSAKAPMVLGPISFTANKTIATGVPNTVVFKYNVQNLQADEFYLQQSWNEKHRESIDPTVSNFSSTYYTPGFHRAKLVANDSIVKMARVHIKTNGWLPLVKYHRDDLVPIYIRNQQTTHEGSLSILPDQLQQAGVDMTKNFILNYHNVREFDGLESSNLQLQTRVKLDSIGNYACPQISITMVNEEGIFYIPLTSLGCVGNIGIKFGEVVKNSRNSDLSALGVNPFDWQELQVSIKDKKASIQLNQVEVFEAEYSKDYGLLMGLVISFTGPGSVDYVKVLDSHGGQVLNDTFQ